MRRFTGTQTRPAPEQVNITMSAAGEENHQLTETPRTSRQVRSQRTYTIHETTLHTLRKFNRDTGDTTRFVTPELKTRAKKLHWADSRREAEDRMDGANTERGVHRRSQAPGPGPLTTASCTQPEGPAELGEQGKVCKNILRRKTLPEKEKP